MSFNVFTPWQVTTLSTTANTSVATDMSIQYLYTIFGPMNGVIASETAGSITITMLGTMFQVFNATVLAVGALMVVYVTVVGVMATAHEGEFMGKNWNNIWIPIRTVLGIASMVPTSEGYSGIQIVMMWVVMQGIGAADTLWNTVLGYVAVVGPPASKATVAISDPTATLKELFKGMVCYRSAMGVGIQSSGGVVNNPTYSKYISYTGQPYYCGSIATSGGSPCTDTFPPTVATLQQNTSFVMGPAGSCGTLSYCNYATSCTTATSLACLSCTAQINAIQTILSTFQPIADMLVQADYNYNYYYKSSIAAASFPTKPQPAPPSMVSSFCAGQNPPIPTANCNALNSSLPNPNPTNQTSTPMPNSAPSNTAETMYWPYAISPALGNSSNFIATMSSYYQAQLGAVLGAWIQSQITSSSSLNNSSMTSSSNSGTGETTTSAQLLQNAANAGWIYAGAYYYSIAGAASQTLTDSLPTLTMAYSSGTQSPASSNNVMYNYRNNYVAAAAILNAISNQASGSSSGGGQNPSSSVSNSGLPGASDMTDQVKGTTQNVTEMMTGTASGQGSGDPVANLITIGSALLWAAFACYLAILILLLILGIAGNIDIFVLGSGAVDPLGPAMALVGYILFPALLAFIGIMVSVGGMLSIYVPLIPYTIFLMGAIGWLLSVIEAMVAGPLVSLGILSPSGRHDILGKAEPALGFLFSLFLRPSLMIFGMIAAMLLAGVSVDMINQVFFTVVLQQVGATNPIGLVIFLMAYVSLVVSVLNKCFSAIHVIPERVMGWISITGVPSETGESAVQSMRQATEKGAASAQGATEAGLKGSSATAAAGGKKIDRMKAEAAKKKQAAIKPTDTSSEE